MSQLANCSAVRNFVSLKEFCRSSPRRTSKHCVRGRPQFAVNDTKQQDADRDRDLRREIAQMMPDPHGTDDLLAADSGSGSGDAWAFDGSSRPDRRMQDAYDDLLTGSDFAGSSPRGGGRDAEGEVEFRQRLQRLPPPQQQEELQWRADEQARREWEEDKAQKKAMELHHCQMEGSNTYEMCLRLGEIMNDLEEHDWYNKLDGQDRTPSWVRAHFVLETELVRSRASRASLPPWQLAQADDAAAEDSEPLLPGVNEDYGAESVQGLLQEVVGDDYNTDSQPASFATGLSEEESDFEDDQEVSDPAQQGGESDKLVGQDVEEGARPPPGGAHAVRRRRARV